MQDYYDYLEDKYNEKELRSALPPETKVPTITYPKTQAFLLRYGDGYQIKTNVVPDEGYAVASLRVATVFGKKVKVVNNSFEMPDEEVVIYVSFRKLTNPNTSAFAFIWILCLAIVGIASYTVFKPEKKSN